MSRSRPRTFHFSQQFQRVSSYEEFAKSDNSTNATDSNGIPQPPLGSIETCIHGGASKLPTPLKAAAASSAEHQPQEVHNQVIKSSDQDGQNKNVLELKESFHKLQHSNNIQDKLEGATQEENINSFQGYSYFRMPLEQQPFKQDEYELKEEDLSFLVKFNQTSQRKTNAVSGEQGEIKLDNHAAHLKEVSPEEMSKLLMHFENRSTRATTATMKEIQFELPADFQSLLTEEELNGFYEHWKNERQNQEQFRQGEPNAPKETCPLLRKFWRATIEEKSYNQTFRPHISQKMSTRKTTRPESEIYERLLNLQADFSKHRMLALKLKKREHIKREIAFVSINDFNSSIPGLSAAFAIQNKFTSRAQEIRNLSNAISPKSVHKTNKHPKQKAAADAPKKETQLQPQEDATGISPNLGQSTKLSDLNMPGIGLGQGQPGGNENGQQNDDLGQKQENIVKKKKKLKETLKKTPTNLNDKEQQNPNLQQELERQNTVIISGESSLKVKKLKTQKVQKEKQTENTVKSQSLKIIPNPIQGSLEQDLHNGQEQNIGMQGSLHLPAKFESQSIYGENDASSEISRANKADQFIPPKKRKQETKLKQVLQNGQLAEKVAGDRRGNLSNNGVVSMFAVNKKEEYNMSLNNQIQEKGNNLKQKLKLESNEEIAQLLSSFFMQSLLPKLPLSIENIGDIEKIIESNKYMQEDAKRKIKNQNIVAFQIIKRVGRSNRECIDRRCAELQDVFGIQSGKVSYFLNSKNEVVYNTFNFPNPEVLRYFGMVDSGMGQHQAAQLANNKNIMGQEINDGSSQVRKEQKQKEGIGSQNFLKQPVTPQQQQYFSQKQEKLRQIIRQPLECQEKIIKKRKIHNSSCKSQQSVLWTGDTSDEDDIPETDENFKKSLTNLKLKMERKQKEKEKQLKMQQKMLLEQQKQKDKELQAEQMRIQQQALAGQQGGQGQIIQAQVEFEASNQLQQPYQNQLLQQQQQELNLESQPFYRSNFQSEFQPDYYPPNQNLSMLYQPQQQKTAPSSFYNAPQLFHNEDTDVNLMSRNQFSMLDSSQNPLLQRELSNDFRENNNNPFESKLYHEQNNNQLMDDFRSPQQNSQFVPENLQIQRNNPLILNLNNQLSNENQLIGEQQLLNRKSYGGEQQGQGIYQEPQQSIELQFNQGADREGERGLPPLFNGLPNQEQQINAEQDIYDYLNGDEEQQQQQYIYDEF